MEKQAHGGKLKRRDQSTGTVPLSKASSAETQHGTVVRLEKDQFELIARCG